MTKENKTYELKVEKTIPKPAADVFRAIGEGRLFLNCSADTESLKINFTVGGKYSIEFLDHNMKNQGEFLEIIPFRRIAFTWCQDYDSNPEPDTKVVVELKDLGGKTALTLTHSGFEDLENKNAHEGGWSGGLNDLSQEISIGKIRMVRKFQTSVEKLFNSCKSPATFFGLMGDIDKGKVDFRVGGKYQVPGEKSEIRGEFLEIVPLKKIVFSWESAPCGEALTHDTKVTLLFEEDGENVSWLELLHEGLETESQQKTHRAGWDSVLKKLK